MDTEEIIDSETIIDKIQKTRDNFYNMWSGIKFDEVEKMRDVWTDEVGRLFIDKLLELSRQVNNVLDELDTLKDCWSRYLSKKDDQISGNK